MLYVTLCKVTVATDTAAFSAAAHSVHVRPAPELIQITITYSISGLCSIYRAISALERE